MSDNLNKCQATTIFSYNNQIKKLERSGQALGFLAQEPACFRRVPGARYSRAKPGRMGQNSCKASRNLFIDLGPDLLV